MHALTARVPKRGRNVSVESLVFLFNHPVRTLFYSGTSHSFISASIVDSLHLSTCIVEDPIIVSNPIGGSAHLSLVCKDLRIAILSIESKCNAYVFGFMGYGLILGMDWLASNCERRVVRLSTCLGNSLEISCDPKGSVCLSYLESLNVFIDDFSIPGSSL